MYAGSDLIILTDISSRQNIIQMIHSQLSSLAQRTEGKNRKPLCFDEIIKNEKHTRQGFHIAQSDKFLTKVQIYI